MNEKYKEDDREKLKALPFTMTSNQFQRLKKLKKEGYIKTMYMLRFSAYYIATVKEEEIKAYRDFGFNTTEGVPYKVDLPIELYKLINERAKKMGYSMSKLMRISLNDILDFMEEEKNG